MTSRPLVPREMSRYRGESEEYAMTLASLIWASTVPVVISEPGAKPREVMVPEALVVGARAVAYSTAMATWASRKRSARSTVPWRGATSEADSSGDWDAA